MNKKIILGILILLFFFITTCQAYWLHVHPMAFFGEREDTDDYNSYNKGYVKLDSGTEGHLTAPVYFPHDKKYVKQLKVRLYDSTATGSVHVYLYRTDLAASSTNSVFYVGTSYGGTPGWTSLIDNTGSNRFINNAKFAWSLEIYFSGSAGTLRVGNVRIKYE